ncbi:targeting protein for Xklp2 homolog isoform X2 [Saccostrea echinata]|uniref:targeting protein for Xklp2 homolog isoform X2 n=1 Tax=Saccostrea echinata TaxID=191078 RepID=UPI002A8081FC|nr:targeting protein for Xklp2 homolog isoform X2 [Saccostrea echinata]
MSMDILGDDVWEYNAPQYVDFAAGEDDPNADAWFDQQNEHGNNPALKEDVCATPPVENRRLTRSMCATPQNEKNLPEATEKKKTPAKKLDTPSRSVATKTDGSKTTDNNIDGLKTTDDKKKSAMPLKQAPVSKSTPDTRGRSRSLKRTNSMRVVNPTELHKRRSADPVRVPVIPSADKPPEKTVSNPIINKAKSMIRRSASRVQDGPKEPRERTRSIDGAVHSRTQSTTSSGPCNNTSQNEVAAPTSKMPKLTVPTTPTFMRRKPIGKTEKVKTSEEKQLEEIANIKAEFNKRKKMTQKSYQTAMKSTGVVPVHSKMEPTKPEPIHFETDSRIKSHPTNNNSADKKVDFVRILRSNSRGRSPAPAERVPTKPQPFKLSEGRKRKADTDSETYKSMAEQLVTFHKQTPDRFHSHSKKVPEKTKSLHSRSPVPGLTVPKTPNFESTSRSRPVLVPSQKDLEEKEIEEMKKNQFKAHPVNKKILSNPNTGVKKVTPKPVTKFEEFEFEGGRRPHNNSMKRDKEEKYEFHAQPAPKKILEGPVGIKPVKSLPVTLPQSPAFCLRQRVRLPMPKEEEEEVSKVMKSHAVPHVGVPFQPILNHKSTIPEPFTFEERDKLAMAKKQEKIEEIYEEERKMREFHAQPLPVGEDALPLKKTKPATIPEPFHLEADERGAKRLQEFSHKVEEENKQLKAQAKFKAHPAKVVHQEPFCPQKSTKPLTDISGFELNTEHRSQKRENFEMYKKAREAQLEAAKREIERQKEEEEKAAVAKMRADAVHKPQRIKRYKSVEVLPSDRPITIAESPNFETDRRLRSKVDNLSHNKF